MGLLEEVEQDLAAQRTAKRSCGVKAVLERLSPAEADELRQILGEPNTKYPHMAIVRVLKARDMHVGRETVAHHRRGVCGCH